MAYDNDSGLVKRGFILLGLMALLVVTVLFILYQGPSAPAPASLTPIEGYAFTVALPTAAFPGNVSWGVLEQIGESVPSPPGWAIRQNANATLARKGSAQVDWNVFREMLDLRRTEVNLREQLPDAQESPAASARELVIAHLKTLEEWHIKRRAASRLEVLPGLPEVYLIVARLTQSSDVALSEQAKKTQASFFHG